MTSVPNVMLQTLSMNYRKIRQTNSTDASYPTTRVFRKAYTGIDNQPAGSGGAAAQTTFAVFDLAKTAIIPGTDRPDVSAKAVDNLVRMCFFGTSAADQTFKARVFAVDYVVERDADMVKESAGWMFTPLFEVLVTLGTQPGIAGTVVNENQFFADTIALVGTAGNDDVSVDIVSPADNTCAHIVADLKGAQKFDVIFDRNSSAASCNGLVKMY